jgi:hypothetical protein
MDRGISERFFDTMGKRNNVSWADDPGFLIFIGRRKRGAKWWPMNQKEGGRNESMIVRRDFKIESCKRHDDLLFA